MIWWSSSSSSSQKTFLFSVIPKPTKKRIIILFLSLFIGSDGRQRGGRSQEVGDWTGGLPWQRCFPKHPEDVRPLPGSPKMRPFFLSPTSVYIIVTVCQWQGLELRVCIIAHKQNPAKVFTPSEFSLFLHCSKRKLPLIL